MKPRILLTVVALVLFPTALLTILATRALKDRELVLQKQLEDRAVSSIHTVANRIRHVVADELESVGVALAESISRGGKYHDAAKVVERLEASHPLVERVFLFVHPWGLMYPQEEDVEGGNRLRPGWDYLPETGWPAGNEKLMAALRREIGSIEQPDAIVHIRLDGRAFCFSHISVGRALYAGFEISLPVFRAMLTLKMAESAGEEYVLVLGETQKQGSEEDVVKVSDSFSPSSPRLDGNASSRLESIAEGVLLPPFSDYRVNGFLRDPRGMERAGRLRARLLSWGILLAALGICGGVWLIFRMAVEEIRRAKERSDFVIGVSHDLRTPVSSMKMLVESLYLEHVPEKAKQKQFLGTVIQECDRLADMIERVLFFVRYGQKALTYRMTPLHTAEFVERAVESFRRRVGATDPDAVRPVDLLLETDGLSDIQGDESALSQVLLNLLDNAEKYGRKTGAKGLGSPIEVKVDQVARRGRKWVRIAVRDEGEGIEKRHLRKIFRQFYRTPSSNRANLSGVGLGLALCRSIIKAHGGNIEVESEVGKGSTFTIYLPV